jgi:hypothetical protein
MKIKKGANIQGIDIRIRPILVAAERLWKEFGQQLVITCGTEGTHSARSLHYYGLALDLRINYFTLEQQTDIANLLRVRLQEIDKHFDVVLHSTHIHVEFDLFKIIIL